MLQNLLRKKPARRSERGFTLIELVASVGVFMVVVGVSSRVLVNFYFAMDISEQRAAATQNCINVINELRNVRSQPGFVYPTSLTNLYAPGAVIQDSADTPENERMTSLPNETLTVQYATADGTILDASGVANALMVQIVVTSNWQTLKGGEPATVTVSTYLSEG